MRVTLVMFLMITLNGGVAPDTPGIGPGGGITDIIPIISSLHHHPGHHHGHFHPGQHPAVHHPGQHPGTASSRP